MKNICKFYYHVLPNALQNKASHSHIAQKHYFLQKGYFSFAKHSTALSKIRGTVKKISVLSTLHILYNVLLSLLRNFFYKLKSNFSLVISFFKKETHNN